VKKLYGLRSSAAHGADFDEILREKPPRGADRTFKDPEVIEAVLQDAPELIAAVVDAILDLGSFPDYSRLELCPDARHKRTSSP
jgi:hypothetical protein